MPKLRAELGLFWVESEAATFEGELPCPSWAHPTLTSQPSGEEAWKVAVKMLLFSGTERICHLARRRSSLPAAIPVHPQSSRLSDWQTWAPGGQAFTEHLNRGQALAVRSPWAAGTGGHRGHRRSVGHRVIRPLSKAHPLLNFAKTQPRWLKAWIPTLGPTRHFLSHCGCPFGVVNQESSLSSRFSPGRAPTDARKAKVDFCMKDSPPPFRFLRSRCLTPPV